MFSSTKYWHSHLVICRYGVANTDHRDVEGFIHLHVIFTCGLAREEPTQSV